MNKRLSKVEYEIVNSGLHEFRDHLLSIILADFNKILSQKEKGLSTYQISTGDIFWKINHKLETDDIVKNPNTSRLLSKSLTEILGGQNVNVGEFRKEFYLDMCGSKRTIEGLIYIDLQCNHL